MTDIAIDTLRTADYVAAVPVLAGVAPTGTDPLNEIVVIFTKDGRVPLTIRDSVEQDPDGFATVVAGHAAAFGVDAARIVLVTSIKRLTTGYAIADAVRDHLARAGVPIAFRVHTFGIFRDGSWQDIDTHESGLIPDPAATAIAIAHAADGRIITASRAEIEGQFQPGTRADLSKAIADSARPEFPTETLDSLRRVIAAYSDAAAARDSYNAPATAADAYRRAGIDRADLASRVGVLVRQEVPARDALVGLARIDVLAAAIVDTDIANQLTGHDRAHVLAAASIGYYIAGMGNHAHDALRAADKAARTNPGETPELVKLMIAAYKEALSVELALKLLDAGACTLAKYGIIIPDSDIRA
ncbi:MULTISPECIES: DUF4192 family protein [Nocardia]|uniref:DUF4192 family protein n=1 Tax=Nocardia TaxID=1817 RepID=UPI0024576997|nr:MULTISPECIES: DUF4192 family protein [Nocardia]